MYASAGVCTCAYVCLPYRCKDVFQILLQARKQNQTVKLPAKWLALAALTEGIFSKKSDVVSCVPKTGCNLRECIPIARDKLLIGCSDQHVTSIMHTIVSFHSTIRVVHLEILGIKISTFSTAAKLCRQ